MLNRSELRRQMRTQRQQLARENQQISAEKIIEQVCRSTIFQQSTHIAAYVAHAGEIDPLPILRQAWQLKKTCYLPVIQAHKQLCFVQYAAGDLLTPNIYKILEPAVCAEKTISPAALDLVLAPLVAFDQHNNRLGMGSGFYDTTFAFLKDVKRPAKPYLLGLAYEWQRCASTYPEAWDIQLDAVATEQTIYFTG